MRVSACSMCRVASGSSLNTWDQPIVRTDAFVVVPSLGSLVPGWLLLIPRVHVPSLAHIEDGDGQELDGLWESASGLVAEEWGSTMTFEHGPAHFGSGVSCTVDHAHLHVLPNVGGWSLEDLAKSAPNLKWVESDALTNPDFRDRDYLLARIKSRTMVGSDGQIMSQHFRRLVATELGVPGEWNWRDYPHIGRANDTLASLTAKRLKSA